MFNTRKEANARLTAGDATPTLDRQRDRNARR
jgi:hypothetical protein